MSIVIGGFAAILSQSAGVFYRGFELSAIYSIFAWLILVILDFVPRLKYYPQNRKINLDIRQSKKIKIEGDYYQIMKSLNDSLKRIKLKSIDNSGIDSGIISAYTTPSMRTYGEKIEIILSRNKKSRINTITISSKPIYSKTTIDFGKNLHNVENIAEKLYAYIHERFSS